MQHLQVSGMVQPLYELLGFKGLTVNIMFSCVTDTEALHLDFMHFSLPALPRDCHKISDIN